VILFDLKDSMTATQVMTGCEIVITGSVVSASMLLSLALSSAYADDNVHAMHIKSDYSISPETVRLHVEEASQRFLIPSSLIWAVIKVESAGDIHALSDKGAMGLMQIMPQTWQMLRQQYRLGNDPYAPRNNILAGSAYLRDLYKRYGEYGALAAYNAGPGRYDDYLKGRRMLPAETVDYISKVSRRLRPEIAQGTQQTEFLRNHTDHDDLFIRSSFAQDHNQAPHDTDITITPASAHKLVDLSAITPTSDGLFVKLSER